jgi:hypothetical protein
MAIGKRPVFPDFHEYCANSANPSATVGDASWK